MRAAQGTNSKLLYDHSLPVAVAVPSPQNSSFHQPAFAPATIAKSCGNGAAAVPPPTFSPRQEAALDSLKEQGYSYGLVKSMFDSKRSFCKRIWIVDNSGSMNNSDGHRFVETSSKHDVQVKPSTRWQELQECVGYHIQLASAIEAPTEFRFLNKPGGRLPQCFGVACGPARCGDDGSMQAMGIIRDARPDGYTPITAHIMNIRNELMQQHQALRSTGQGIVVVIATDGLPTDYYGYGGQSQQNEFVNSLRSLQGLPVSIVIRLCTSEAEVVGFYNTLSSMLNFPIEVLSDFMDEAKKVHEHNPWLTYALPLHRMREMGYNHAVLDVLDKQPLSKGGVGDFVTLLYGDKAVENLADPTMNWKDFSRGMKGVVSLQKEQWNPIQKRVAKWMDLKVLNACYSGTCYFNPLSLF